MNETYMRFKDLLDKKGITPYRIHKETRIATSTLSDWKNGKSIPKHDKLLLIANYLGTSVEYLMTGKEVQYTKEKARLIVSFAKFDEKSLKTVEKYGKLSEMDRKTIDDMVNFLSNKTDE